MKRAVRVMALLMAVLMMILFCSCSAKESAKNEKDEGGNPGRVISSDQFKSGDEDYGGAAGFSGSIYNQIFGLSFGVIGKDLKTAEEMIGDFFGVEPIDKTGNILTTTINGVVTTEHVYVQMLVKDTVRFNGMVILTGKDNGLVKRVEFALSNSDYTHVHIDDTSEFRDEIRKLNRDLIDELKKAYGEAFETDILVWDEDSIYYSYNVSDNCFAYVEIRDFTEPGGNDNDLVATTLIFADCKELLVG